MALSSMEFGGITVKATVAGSLAALPGVDLGREHRCSDGLLSD